MKKIFLFISAIITMLFCLYSSMPAASDGLYQCVTEKFTNMIVGFKSSNQLMYDLYTENGRLTIDEAAKTAAQKELFKKEEPLYKCQNKKFMILDVEKRSDGFLNFKGYKVATKDEIANACPSYYRSKGDPCR